MTYKIVRHRFDQPNEVVATGLTLDEAQAHCQDDSTHGDGWFDGYTVENPTAEEISERMESDQRLLEGVRAVERLTNR